MPQFELDATYSPTADQPAAIRSLADGGEPGAASARARPRVGEGGAVEVVGPARHRARPAHARPRAPPAPGPDPGGERVDPAPLFPPAAPADDLKGLKGAVDIADE